MSLFSEIFRRGRVTDGEISHGEGGSPAGEDGWCRSCKLVSARRADNRCSRCGTRLQSLPLDPNAHDYIIQLTQDTVKSFAGEKDLVIREVAYEAIDKTANLLKSVALLVTVIVAAFAFGGVRDLATFFSYIKPEIKTAQSSLQVELQQEQANEHSLNDLHKQLDLQKNKAGDIDAMINKSRLQAEAIQNQVDQATKVLPAQTAAAAAQLENNSLIQDFPVLTTGAQLLKLDGHLYRPVQDKTLSSPLVYLQLPLSANSILTMAELKDFISDLKTNSYRFISGNFVLQEGNVSFAGNVIPGFSQCSQIVYYDKSFLSAAQQVATLLSRAFSVPLMIPRLIDLSSNVVVDTTSKAIIQQSGVGVAASLASPDPAYCKQILGR